VSARAVFWDGKSNLELDQLEMGRIALIPVHRKIVRTSALAPALKITFSVWFYSPRWIPPSAKMVWPVMYDARSEASQAITSAISFGLPSRRTGVSAAHVSQIC